ncbi:MAG: NTP transferase domain-containing protein [Verrucomicrobiales bacterium]|nr:NTP transferase domain-containing protein [Verrucomicrobiales bacterium]
MSDSSNLYALILAGGSGTRFWPLSRNVRPKQLLNLFDEETLIEKAVKRLDGLIPPERILVLTNEVQVEGIREALPMIPAENVVAEPARRDTAPAIALAAGWIAARNPDATMIALPADQLVIKDAEFRSVLQSAADAASAEDAIVTLGIRPDWACPSYGYIERGEQSDSVSTDHAVHQVNCFREKPSVEVAEEYLESGNFSWNAGIFIWTIQTLLRELSQHCPQLSAFVETLRDADDFSSVVEEQFPGLDKVSIDYALMENAKTILNIEADVGWDDVGGWPSVAKYLNGDDSNNSSRGKLVSVDSSNNIVFSATDDTTIALLGVSDLIVVKTADAVLVADRNDADQIKKLVDVLPPELL